MHSPQPLSVVPIILCLALGTSTSRAEADIYRWVTSDGILSFGQSPPHGDIHDLTRLDDTVEGTATAPAAARRPEVSAAARAPLTATATAPAFVAEDFQETMLMNFDDQNR